MTILVVEDTDDSRILLVDLLGAQGYEVESAVNGVEALEKIRIAPPDIIISDILMPEMDGFELCRILKKDRQLKKIPVIFYTATYTEPRDQKLALSMGAARFIIKPEDPGTLLKIIAEVMDESEKCDPENVNEQHMENGVIVKQHRDAVSNKLYKKVMELEAQKGKLKKSEKKYRMMMESITDAVYICSPERKITYLNPAMKKRIGRDATGEFCYKALHGLDAQCEWCVFDSLKPDGGIENDVFSPLDNRTYRINNMPIYHDDNSVSKMSIYKDITDYLEAVKEKKKIQNLLAQTQKMESIGTLAGGIAHDFNNILASIIGYSELALGAVEKGSQMEGDLLEIHRGGLRAKELVWQILIFARQSDETVKPLKVAPLVKETLKFIHSTIPANIDIVSNIESKYRIMGNPTQIHQIFMNLFTNASHAMSRRGGTLKVDVIDTEFEKQQSIQYVALAAGKYVKIEVSDTGEGISNKIIDSIFDPYFTTKKQGEGTGLGLAVVQGIIENYKGKIFVESKVGYGSKFTVYLPSSEEKVSQEPEFQKKLPTGTESILLVDDEAPIVKAAKRSLEELGYSVQTKISASEALDLFKSRPNDFDLVISDVTMPYMTGDALAAELMSIRPDIPIILCTGYSKNISDQSAAEIGIKAFALKPVVKADLAKTVRKVLDEAKG
nr:response regulator [uncultured Desulfobacter sp.]